MTEAIQTSQKSTTEPATGAGTPSRLRQAVQESRRLVADWSEILVRRKQQQRGGLYLPLVGIGRQD